jgi:glycosidase
VPENSTGKVPAWLNNPTLYHNRGDTTFVGENSLYGDFFGLDDLFTEHPAVVDGMLDIYKGWITDFGIDGFRLDTMKHVNDEFWQEFAPEIVAHARAAGKSEFFMFGEVFDTTKDFTSHFTTRNRVQAVADFPFQAAAQRFAASSDPTDGLRDFFFGDDWYTDADSNVYQLPTFLGNHDMGRIGSFIKLANPGASDDELLDRDVLAHALMYLTRGNPTVYYGDEQGFVGDGGDQDARQDMFPSQVASYNDDDLIGNAETTAEDNFDQSTPLYGAIAELAELTRNHPALRSGAQQHRLSRSAAGIYAFSRFDRGSAREYVVALNNSEEPKSALIPTSAGAGASFELLYGSGAPGGITDGSDRLPVVVQPLSAVVYRSTAPIPQSPGAPTIQLVPLPDGGEARGRIEVRATVFGDSFYDVAFEASVGGGPWSLIGTDDNAPFRVFHDVSGQATGTTIHYRATVADNAGHMRTSETVPVEVAEP